jgi:hypothetical protein
METTLASVERQYERAIVKLNEAIQTQAPMRPSSLRVEYEYNMALINSAIATTRDVARKTPEIRKPLSSCSRLIKAKSI